jgi:hypothetical protein
MRDIDHFEYRLIAGTGQSRAMGGCGLKKMTPFYRAALDFGPMSFAIS